MNYIICTALIFNSVSIPFEAQEDKLSLSLTILCISALDSQFYVLYVHVTSS